MESSSYIPASTSSASTSSCTREWVLAPSFDLTPDPSYFRTLRIKKYGFAIAIILSLGLLGTGLGLHFGTSTHQAINYSLIGGGGSALIGTFAIWAYLRLKKEKLLIASMNTGVYADYQLTQNVRLNNPTKQNLGQIYQQLRDKKTKLEKPAVNHLTALKTHLEALVSSQKSPSIICLQEVWQFTTQDLNSLVPGYATVPFINNQDDCTILYDTSRFSLIAHATAIDSKSKAHLSKFAYFYDAHLNLCVPVGSFHTSGFSLLGVNGDLESDETKEVTKLAKKGDDYLAEDLQFLMQPPTSQLIKDMKLKIPPAKIHIAAGDLNATAQHYPARLEILFDLDFQNDSSWNEPTMFDANLIDQEGKHPLPVKLDHIFARGGQVREFSPYPEGNSARLWNFDRPSDHLAVMAEVKFK